LSEFFAYWPNRLYLIISLFIQAITLFLSYYIFKNLTGTLLVLHYNVDFGINWIGDSYKIFYFPLISFLLSLLSLLVLFAFGPSKHFRFQSNMLMIAVLMTNLGFLAALLLVYIINFK